MDLNISRVTPELPHENEDTQYLYRGLLYEITGRHIEWNEDDKALLIRERSEYAAREVETLRTKYTRGAEIATTTKRRAISEKVKTVVWRRIEPSARSKNRRATRWTNARLTRVPQRATKSIRTYGILISTAPTTANWTSRSNKYTDLLSCRTGAFSTYGQLVQVHLQCRFLALITTQ